MKGFYSRKNELDILEGIFKNLDGPKIVQITAASGIGKTRLIQEFYSKIAKKSSYWKPINSEIGKKEIEIIPEYENSASKLDWLFLSTRSIEKTEHQYDFTFDKIRHQFSIHLPQIIKFLKGKSLNKKIAKSTISVLANFAIPGSGNIIEVLNTIKDFSSDSSDLLDLLQDVRKKAKNKSHSHENEFYVDETKNIIKSTLLAFKEIFKKEKDFRIILYFEDFHWIDQFSQLIIYEIISEAYKNNWKVLFLISNWPAETAKTNSFEFQTLNDFSFKIRNFENDLITEINLGKLKKTDLINIVKDRLPQLDNEGILILIGRCKGDLDLLNDFIDEILQTPGWLNEKGELQVNYSYLKKLPAKAIDMARVRLLSFPDKIRNHLLWSSLQGVVFDFKIINLILEKNAVDDDYRKSISISKNDYKVITANESKDLELTCEFRRAVFYESAKTLIERHPLIDKIQFDLATLIAELLNSGDISDRIRIVESFLALIKYINPLTPNLVNTKIKSLVEISRHKLLVGDYNSVIKICTNLLDENITINLKNRLYFLLTEAYYYKGDSKNEAKTFELWKSDDVEEDYRFEIQYSKYLRRNSKPKEALKYVEEAMNKVVDLRLKILTSIEYIKNLWSLGKIEQAYKKLKTVEDEVNQINDKDLNISFSHAACLVLHDLDKSSQVIQHSLICIEGYEQSGDIQSELISRVNYADALWALGYLEKASQELLKISKIATENELPHAIDISEICHANVLSEQKKYTSSEKRYIKGIQLAKEIKHDWDAIYGTIYSKLNELRRGHKVEEKEIFELVEKSVNSNYHYLADLAYSLLCSFYILNNKSLDEPKINYIPKLPIGNLFLHSNLILTDSYNLDTIRSFLSQLGKVEGLKFNREMLILTINKLIEENIIQDNVLTDFAIRWKNKFDKQIEKDEAIKLKSCDYKLCEARCCYDGVYLEDENEEKKIKSIVNKYPEYFEHLPKNYIVEGIWGNITGKKTAVKQHKYISPDFPNHFNQTRCVFAMEDGACSLQKASMERGENPWEFKPIGCRIHPLQTKNSEFFAPASTIEKDKYDIGLSYPGYTNYTPCGENRIDGKIWINVLANEVKEYENN